MKKLVFIVLSIMLFSALYGQWSSDSQTNLPINTFAGDQAIPKVAIANNSNIFIGFFSAENSNYDIRLQLLDPNGNTIWENGGILISNHPQMSWLTDWDLKTDNSGNAIIAFQDIRSEGNNNVVAYCISQNGEFLWENDGIMLSNTSAFDVSPKIAILSSGNIIIAWQSDAITRIQKISPSGELLFGNDGLSIEDANATISWPQIIALNNDQFIIKYFKDSGPTWSPTRKIFARKYSGNGDIIWDIPIDTAGGISAWTQILSIDKDDNGGFYIAWHDDRDNDNFSEIYIQHIDSEGNASFDDNGIQITTNSTNNHFEPKLKFMGEYIITVWNETDANQNQRGIYAQKISLNGELLWGENGKEILPLSSLVTVLSDIQKLNDDFVIYYYQNPSATNDYIYAQRLNENGDNVWINPVTTISNYDSEKLHIDTSVFDNNQQSVIVWEDRRVDDSGDIYAQNLLYDGSIGSNTAPSVSLTSFDLEILNNDIVINWETLNEQNLQGWLIYRNNENNFENATQLNTELIPANNTQEESDYQYIDDYNLTEGETYYYWLQAVGTDISLINFGPSEILYQLTDSQNDNLSLNKIYFLNNYPNPFNPTTQIKFKIGKDSNATLEIFNIKGQKITTIFKGFVKANQTITKIWNANGLESGIYFYKLRTAKKSLTKQMILMK